MIDTLKLESGAISEDLAAQVEGRLCTRLGVDNSTGNELYNLCSGSLPGSFSSSVAVNVLRRRWDSWKDVHGKTRTELVESPPYLTLEGSVHKAICGHNITGGPERIAAAVAWFVADVGQRLGVELPAWDTWTIQRVDVTECYDLGGFEGVRQYLHGLALARYPRRQPRRYGDECVFFAGTTTALKFYHKGPEFAKNGHRALSASRGVCYSQSMQDLANRVLRVEVSIKRKKLTELYPEGATARVISDNEITALYDREIARVLQEGQDDMETVRNHDVVHRRLHEVYSDGLATVLYGTWLTLAALGEEHVRRSMSRPTYYRQKKQLSEAGVTWDGTDVQIRKAVSAFPVDFRPVRRDPRRLVGESLEVREALLSVRCA